MTAPNIPAAPENNQPTPLHPEYCVEPARNPVAPIAGARPRRCEDAAELRPGGLLALWTWTAVAPANVFNIVTPGANHARLLLFAT